MKIFLILIILNLNSIKAYNQDLIIKGVINYEMIFINENGICNFDAVLYINDDYSKFNYKSTDEAKETTEQDSNVDSKISVIIPDTTSVSINLHQKTEKIYTILSNDVNKSYYENIPTLPWILTDKTKIINNFNCNQALVSFKGRDYIAYYSTDIPLSYGPYKFHGLPGLILEITDDINEVFFRCKSLTIPALINFKNEIDFTNIIKTKEMFIKEQEIVQKQKLQQSEERLERLAAKADRNMTIKFETKTKNIRSIELY